MLQAKHVTLVSTVVASIVSCGGQNHETRSKVDAFPKLANRWNSPEIPVCWETSPEFTDGFAEEKDWVREKVIGQYEQYTNVSFRGWKACETADTEGIRIGVEDAGPQTKGLGKVLNGVRNGMRLNFTFENWSTSCQANRKRCIQGIAVHEFGHAVGLAHEQNRADTPSTCTSPGQGSQGDVTVGDWDLHSVMNYCNPVYNNNGNLSADDINGINKMYGTP